MPEPLTNESEMMSHVSPGHYKDFDVSPTDLAASYDLNYFEGNVIKYVARWRKKDGEQDLFKALWYLLFLVGTPKHQIDAFIGAIQTNPNRKSPK